MTPLLNFSETNSDNNMANERQIPMAGQQIISLTPEDLQKLLAAAIEEAKKPWRDEDAEAKKKRDRERLRQQRDEAEAERKARQEACNHSRSDNSSCIAWATQSDGATRGVCMHCNRLFIPTDPDYTAELRRPTRSSHPLAY